MNLHNHLQELQALQKKIEKIVEEVEVEVSRGGWGCTPPPLSETPLNTFHKNLIINWLENKDTLWVNYKEFDEFSKKVGMKTIIDLVYEYTGERIKYPKIEEYIRQYYEKTFEEQ